MDRRDFLVHTSAVCGATVAFANSKLGQMAFVNSALAADGGNGHASSLERKLSEFALSIRYQDLPSDVIASAKRVLLDTLACAFGAVGNEPATIAEKTVRKTYGEGNAATIIGYPVGATLEGAVFVNGVLVRSLDLNDTYIGTDPLHPSEVLPTVLALCEEGGRSGRDFIEALVAGYEAGMRVNDAVSFMERGFHPLCAASYATPLIAGKVWGLRKEAIANAVGISAARGFTSFVVNSGAISMMKAMGFAATAADGIFAARTRCRGLYGPFRYARVGGIEDKTCASKPRVGSRSGPIPASPSGVQALSDSSRVAGYGGSRGAAVHESQGPRQRHSGNHG